LSEASQGFTGSIGLQRVRLFHDGRLGKAEVGLRHDSKYSTII
jgi:hypothetical protein